KIECGAMITLFDCVGDVFESSRWMIELPRDFYFQLRVTRHGVIINCDPAIGGDELAALCQYKRVDFQRPRFDAACGIEQLSNGFAELRRLLWREPARTNSFFHG